MHGAPHRPTMVRYKKYDFVFRNNSQPGERGKVWAESFMCDGATYWVHIHLPAYRYNLTLIFIQIHIQAKIAKD